MVKIIWTGSQHLVLQYVKEVFLEYYLALQFDYPICHCWGDSLTNPMLITGYYSSLTWRSLGALYNKVGSQSRVKHLVGFELGSFQFSM